MKYFLLFVSPILLYKTTCGQCKQEKYNAMMISVGIDKTFINADALNAWTQTNYNKTVSPGITGSVDIGFLFRHVDAGISAVIPNPYRILTMYAGARLTHLHSKLTSFLNINTGTFDALYNHLAPVNYVLTADQQGKSMQLQYNAWYWGLSSKNYWKHRMKKSGYYVIGLETMIGYTPRTGGWNYGYYKGSGEYAGFVPTRVQSIPALNTLIVNTGVFVGITSR